MRFLSQAAIAATLAASAVAQSPLTTLFASDNGGGPGGAVFFDLAATNGIEINAFDINTSATAGNAVTMDVYLHDGTSAGFEQSVAGWVLVSTGSGTSSGTDVATNMTLTRPICVPAGASVGVAIVLDASSAHRYTGIGTTAGVPEVYTNADLTLDAGQALNVPFAPGTVFDPRVFNGAVYYSLNSTCSLPTFPPNPTNFVGIGEPAGTGGALTTSSPQAFEDGWDLRVNIDDFAGTNTGDFGAAILNVGLGGSPPVGVTAAIPGFDQVWAGSAPAGIATVFTTVVGNPDLTFNIPAGLFNPGDVARFQGLVLEPSIGGAFPVLPTLNSIEFVHRNPVSIEVRCDGSNSFNSNTAFGYFSVTNVAALDITDLQFDWVTSSNAGQATMEFDTDQGGMADLFEGGNGGAAGCAGTYRNGSDAATGLVYDAANTVPATPCDATALTGWTGTNAGNAVEDWRTLDFRFTSFAAGDRFEFDCDTDGGAGIGGDDMAGMVVTITLSDSSVLTGEVQATGTDLGQLFF